MVQNSDYQKTKIQFIVKAPDSEEATLLDVLESDLEDFFFGVKVTIETDEENAKRKDNPLKTIKYNS